MTGVGGQNAGGAAWKQRYDAKFPGQFQIYSPTPTTLPWCWSI